MANRFVSPEQQFINNSGQPYAGGQLFFYISGTSTPSPTYQDKALSTPNPNPVVLDSAGNAGSVFLDPAVVYKVILEDVNNNVIWTFDPVIPTDAPTSTAVNAIISCTASGTNAITLTPISASQLPGAYANYTMFAFVPAVTTTGAVTAQVGALAFFPVYLTNGTQAAANDFVAGSGPYFIAYGSVVAGASPGFILLNQNSGSTAVAISGTTTVSNIHNNKILQLGGGSFYAVTFPAGSSLAPNFKCTIVNEETTPVGKGIGGVNIGSFTLYPGQSYTIFNDGGTIRALGGKKLYIVNSVAVYLDTGLGSDDPLVSDGLGNTTRAYKTANNMWSSFKANFDHNGSGGASLNTMAGTITESNVFSGQPINCPVFFVNGPSALGTTWKPSPGGTYCWIVGDRCVMEYSNIQFDDSGGTSAVAIQKHQTAICDQNSGCGFGSFGTSGGHITGDGCGWTYNINASYAVNGAGGASTHLDVPSTGWINHTGSITVTITNAPNISFWLRASASGANISLGSSITFAGAPLAGCTKWSSGPASLISFSGNAANIPGSIAGNPATGSAPSATTGWALA